MSNKRVALSVIDPTHSTGCGWCCATCPDNLLVLESIKGKKSASLINADVCPGCAKWNRLQLRGDQYEEKIIPTPNHFEPVGI